MEELGFQWFLGGNTKWIETKEYLQPQLSEKVRRISFESQQMETCLRVSRAGQATFAIAQLWPFIKL